MAPIATSASVGSAAKPLYENIYVIENGLFPSTTTGALIAGDINLDIETDFDTEKILYETKSLDEACKCTSLLLGKSTMEQRAMAARSLKTETGMSLVVVFFNSDQTSRWSEAHMLANTIATGACVRFDILCMVDNSIKHSEAINGLSKLGLQPDFTMQFSAGSSPEETLQLLLQDNDFADQGAWNDYQLRNAIHATFDSFRLPELSSEMVARLKITHYRAAAALFYGVIIDMARNMDLDATEIPDGQAQSPAVQDCVQDEASEPIAPVLTSPQNDVYQPSVSFQASPQEDVHQPSVPVQPSVHKVSPQTSVPVQAYVATPPPRKSFRKEAAKVLSETGTSILADLGKDVLVEAGSILANIFLN